MKVTVGQVWKREDARDERFITVVEVDRKYARVVSDAATSRIRLDRFAPGHRGYELIAHANGRKVARTAMKTQKK